MSAGPAGRQPTSTTPFINVGHYGVHWSPDGIAFLEQGGPRGGSNALGLAVKSPFRVRIEGRNKTCNHNIPLAAPSLNPIHQERFAAIATDTLVSIMYPVPKREGTSGVWYVDDPDDKLSLWLSLLSRMSSPIRSIINPIWAMKTGSVVDDLANTNVQPYILCDVQPKHTEIVNQVVKAASYQPRTLILVGRPEVVLPPMAMRIKTAITSYDLRDLVPLPWEAYGATITRKYMRNEYVPYSTQGEQDG